MHRPLALATALASCLLLAPSGAAAADTSSCRGRAATIASEAKTVTGTPGDDVIVSTGRRASIDAGAGDDLVCYRGDTDTLRILGGDGDDVIDTTALQAGGSTLVYLGPGADQFLGGPTPEFVFPDVGLGAGLAEYQKQGEDTISTGDGADDVTARPGDVVSTGNGADQLTLVRAGEQATTERSMRLGRGRDLLYLGLTAPGSRVEVSLDSGTVTADGVSVPITAAEDVSAYGDTVRVLGDGSPNQFRVEACTAVLRGGAGSDRLSLNDVSASDDLDRCTPNSRMRGDAGNDRMSGGDGSDVLLGGPGRDLAQARAGRDTCRAEIANGCERR